LGAAGKLCSDRSRMDGVFLKTERLAFRPFTADDLPLVVELHSDPEVQRYMGGMWSDEEMRATLDRFLRHQATYGMSKWAIFLHDGTFVGRAGVAPFPPLGGKGFGGDRELGYSLKRRFWGAGLATEAARAAADWFFDHTDEAVLIGFTEPGNAASQQVLRKVGMTPIGLHDLGFDEPSAVFRMTRPEPSGPTAA
jgi:ribosomal-protein-alanine N-acetyltransferase